MKNTFTLFKYSIFLQMLIGIVLVSGCEENEKPSTKTVQLLSIRMNDKALDLVNYANNTEIPIDSKIEIRFTEKLDTTKAIQHIKLETGGVNTTFKYYFSTDTRSVFITPYEFLYKNKIYTIRILNTLTGLLGEKYIGADIEFTTVAGNLVVSSFKIDGTNYTYGFKPQQINLKPYIEVSFSDAIDTTIQYTDAIKLVNSTGTLTPLTYSFKNNAKTIAIQFPNKLVHFSKQTLSFLNMIKGAQGEEFNGAAIQFYTLPDSTPKFPVISDEELLTKIQLHTFKYFYDFAHPASGMARERNNSGDLVTIGGSGFGVMALIVGIERNFITRTQGIERFNTIITFLEKADKFHGAWGHWYNGNSGKIIPFSSKDNGGDLVETSFMAQGLLTLRQYLHADVTAEKDLIDRINTLLDGIEWSWYNHDNQNMLSWHWSPTVGWAMGMHVRGYNEALITYFMAASSNTYPIDAQVYHTGWAGTNYFRNGRSFYGITLPLGFDYGGPLFFSHYSFLGLNPKGLSDTYASYWTQNQNHTLINRAYCVANPKKFVGYSEDCWGLTASDDNTGYGVHEPTRDIGVISPTAALSSFPYTPEESMRVAKFLYYVLGDRVWGEYGFYDAFNAHEGWWGKSYLAIDQGPIVVMMENHRSGLLWNLFMSAPETANAMNKLGFTKE